MSSSSARSADGRASAALFLTPEGQDKLRVRLAELESLAERLMSRVVEGAGDEDTAGEYQRTSDEIARLGAALKVARSVEELPPDPRSVVLGDTVAVSSPDGDVDSYIIVDPLEAPFDDRRISSDSPLGRALVGRHVGDVVEVHSPAGPYRCRIVSADRR